MGEGRIPVEGPGRYLGEGRFLSEDEGAVFREDGVDRDGKGKPNRVIAPQGHHQVGHMRRPQREKQPGPQQQEKVQLAPR